MKQYVAEAGGRKARNATTVLLVAAAALAFGGMQAAADPPSGQGAGWSRNDPVCFGTLEGLDLRTATIAEVREHLDKGKFTSVDLVEAYIKRIVALDNRWGDPALDLNGVRLVNGKALADAATADAERAAAQDAGIILPPMHGIPLMMKDNIGTFDMPTTAGSIALENNFPLKDAGVVAKLRENGVVLLGKLELLEWANWGAPSNGSSIGGPQHNAYNGGSASASSSGPGVAGSMAYSAITLGSETSGSILGPTQTNSLAGLKTSHGLVSGAGVIPIAHYFDVVGPMGRNVYDLAVTLDAMAGTDLDDRHSLEADANLPPGGFASMLSTDALEGVRIGYNENNDGTLFLHALEDVRQLGAILVPIGDKSVQNLAGFAEFAVLPNEFHQEINEYFDKEAGPLPFEDWRGLMAWMRENHPETHNVRVGGNTVGGGSVAGVPVPSATVPVVATVPLGASGFALASAATPGSPVVTEATSPNFVTAARALADPIFADSDIAAVFSPGSAFTTLGAAAGYPTAMIPMGYSGDRPQAMSFFGPRFSDGELLSYAYALEQVRERRIVPEDFNPKILAGLCDDVGPPFGDGTGQGPNRAESEEAQVLDVAVPRPDVGRLLG